jgi:hypothetical protein
MPGMGPGVKGGVPMPGMGGRPLAGSQAGVFVIVLFLLVKQQVPLLPRSRSTLRRNRGKLLSYVGLEGRKEEPELPDLLGMTWNASFIVLGTLLWPRLKSRQWSR